MSKTRNVRAPRLAKTKIIDAAKRLMARYEDLVGRAYIVTNGLQFDDFYERIIYPEFKVELYEELDLRGESYNEDLLGRYDVKKNAAFIDESLAKDKHDPRRAFTLWHEVAGHGVLQGKWLREQLERGGLDSVEVCESSLDRYTEDTLERQANLFASQLAAPDWLVNYAVNTTFKPTRTFYFPGECLYWITPNDVARKKYIVDAGDLAGWIGSKIKWFFGGLSAQAIGNRLRDMGWVVDGTTPDISLNRIKWPSC